ncbi:hypothetical protein GCM10009528_12450 [Kineococcus aurantiacus]
MNPHRTPPANCRPDDGWGTAEDRGTRTSTPEPHPHEPASRPPRPPRRGHRRYHPDRLRGRGIGRRWRGRDEEHLPAVGATPAALQEFVDLDDDVVTPGSVWTSGADPDAPLESGHVVAFDDGDPEDAARPPASTGRGGAVDLRPVVLLVVVQPVLQRCVVDADLDAGLEDRAAGGGPPRANGPGGGFALVGGECQHWRWHSRVESDSTSTRERSS